MNILDRPVIKDYLYSRAIKGSLVCPVIKILFLLAAPSLCPFGLLNAANRNRIHGTQVTVVYRFVCVLLIGPHLRDKRDESIDNRNLDLFFSCSAAGIRPKGSLKAGESKAADKEEI
jgi:hypothetical protein